ncbi:MAG: AbrB/MazE/SpoVT family DNA-binding domain-containing protein [Terriglobia bacterium]
MAQTSVERIVAEIQDLSPQERLRLIRTIVDTLIMPGRPAESRRLIYGEFRGGRMESAITVKGQATIPKAIREHLRLKPGDRVKFFVHPDGTVVLLPKLPVSALRGMLTRPRRPVTLRRMREAIAEGAAGLGPHARRR